MSQYWLEDEDAGRQRLQEEMERQDAYAEAARAIAMYRWWRLDNILNRLRMLVTWVKLKLGMRLWP